ncbi:MAG: hypothetical protein PF689_09945 [Deltaproteobacteria bacterium]|jgi:hypothetical protein|nr:hypothetical protein [Deltaproteobacteria bacterium]
MRYKLFLTIFLFFSCKNNKPELSEKTQDKQKLNTEEIKKKTASKKEKENNDNKLKDRSIFRLEIEKKHFVFDNMLIAPSFVFEKNSTKDISKLVEFMNKWEINSYSSQNEKFTALFLSKLIHALHYDKNKSFTKLYDLRKYILYLMVTKEIPDSEYFPISSKDLDKITLNYFNKGYNFYSISLKELKINLEKVKSVIFNQKRTGRIALNSTLLPLKDLFKDSKSEDSEDNDKLETMISFLTKGNWTKERNFRFTPFEFFINPKKDSTPAIWLKFLFSEPNSSSIKNKISSILSTPPFNYGIEVNNKKYYDSYLLLASGTCPLCFQPDDIPGNHELPRNLRKMDWGKYGEKLSKKFFEKKVVSTFLSCTSSYLDFFSIYEHLTENSQNIPGIYLNSQYMSQTFKDNKLLKKIWLKAFVQYLFLNEDFNRTFFKPDCQLIPVFFTTYKYIMQRITRKNNIETMVNGYYLRGLVSNNLPEITPKKENIDPTVKNTKSKKKISFKKYDFFFDPKHYPVLFDKDKLKSRVEQLLIQLSGMHGNPGRWFKEKTIPFDNMISPEKLKEMKEKIIDKEMPEARVYLPAQIIFRGDRINYTHANDASEHFISFY